MFKIKNIVSALATSGILVAGLLSYAERHEMIALLQPPVQAPADTSKPQQRYKPSRRPTYKPEPRYGDPYTNRETKSPMELKTPDNIKTQTELDTAQESYQISEKAGEVDYRPPTEMKFKDYAEWRNRQMSKSYWREKGESTSGGANTPISAKPKGLNPRIQMPPVFDRIFGGNYIDIKPNGMVLLDFGGQFQKTNNPAIPIRQQRSGGFRFDQQISFNLVGKVGERLTIRANWDTKATFDFDNNIKIEYKALEQDIIKRIELGNVSMPTNSSLITGAQNLFGVKAQLQFGRLAMTTVVANQRSKVDEIVIPGGSAGPGKDYEIKAYQYDELRHFWLGQFFRNNYDKWLQSSPFITSGVQITRVEIYVTNRTNATENTRSVTAYLDLGEARRYNTLVGDGIPGEFRNVQHLTRDSVASNSANSLYRNISTADNPNRSGEANSTGTFFGMQSGIDYEIIKSAKKLEENRDFRINRQLGYISLNTQLRTDEALAVAYEYSYQGQIYKVGELNEDYNTIQSTQSAYFKMLRPANINVNIPSFNLMMKNIYQLPSTNINRNGFQLRVVYKDDSTGIDNPFIQQGTARLVDVNGKPTASVLSEFPLVQLFNVDNLNPNGDPAPDGNWDYVGGVTVDSIYGRVIFGVKEPFGRYLESKFDTSTENLLIEKYVFNELYTQTRNNAEQLSKKNKFFLKGRYQSGSSQEIQLQGLNIAQGSIRVLSGSTTLVEGTDYNVNYELGRVRIVNPGILTSGNDITIRFEKADLFNFRQKTLYGTRLDYRIHRDFNIGGTFMHLRERPLITRVSFGDDPLFNTMWGLDFNYTKESRFLTKMVDALPIVQTKEPSNITLKGEVASLLPGTPPQIGKENANMFIDDFEGTETPYDLTRQPIKWVLGSPPREFFDQSQVVSDPLAYTYRRAKLSWYNIDQTAFYQGGAQKPANITDEELTNHYVRSVGPQEIYPQRSPQAGYSNEPTFDLAYFPDERGMYNFNPNLTPEGRLPDPKSNFASLTRAITFDTDFDNANIQYIEFWMMDPFMSGAKGNLRTNKNNTILDNSLNQGGQLWFHLGSVSEDIMKDGKHAFENGLPPDGGQEGAQITPWGKVTVAPYLNNAFSNLGNARDNQDVGLDGLRSSEEQQQYANFVNAVNRIQNEEKKQEILADVSNDNFQYFLSVDSPNILDRYKNYNGMENNSSISTANGFVQSNTNIPDNEDLNQNNTVSDLEQYFEYKVDIRKGADGKLDERSNGFVVGKIIPSEHPDVTWYQVRIPIRTRANPVNGITDFKSIRFIRMIMTGWEQPVVLRMSQFQMVGSLWRPLDTLESSKGIITGGGLEPRNRGKVQLSTVNVEENGSPPEGITTYVVPPEFVRDRDNTSNLNRLQNEQSLRICVDNLEPGDVAPAYKLINLNFINSTSIKMFLHAESNTARDKELEGFLRIGTDFDQNYYDIRVPLTLTIPGTKNDANAIWPAENDVNVPLQDLSFVKAERNKAGFPQNRIFSLTINGKIISVRGNPDYTSTQVVMIGIQNPVTNTRPHQVCIWANELRTSGVNKTAGYAAVGTMNAKLADLANVTATGSYRSAGFGAIDQKITARQRNNTYQYGAASNITMEKFIPGNSGIKVPLYVSYDKKIIKPDYDPLNPDTKLATSLATLEEDGKNERASIVIDRSVRRSVSLNNLQKVKTGQNPRNHFYDIENLTLILGYSDINSSNYLTQRYFFKNYKAGLAYTYGTNPKALEPLKGINSKSRYVQLFTAFNFTPLPSNLSFRTDLDRRFAVTQLRGGNLSSVAPLYEKSFYLNRSYGLRWAFTRSLGMDYRANVNTIIDEPTGEINDERLNPLDPNSITKKDSVLKNLQRFGRVKNFEQNFNFTYRTPLDKIPLVDWTQADLGYNTTYLWKAGAVGYADTLGNQAQNNRTFTVNGKMDLLKLYNKIKFLREINAPLTQTMQEHNQKRDQWKRQLENPSLKQSEKDSLNRLINRQYLSEVRPVRGALQVLMLFKNLNMTYERSEGTALPGFMPRPKFFGLDEESMAPGIPFILGDQSDRIKQEAAEKDWIARSRFQSSPFVKIKATKFTYRTSLEPIKQFRIQLEGRQEQTHTYNEFFRFDDNNNLVTQNPTRSGSFKTSIISAATIFTKDDPLTNKNQVFETFVQNRTIIQNRLNTNRPNEYGRYDTSSQEVIIPAFLAAYTGRDPGNVTTSAFPAIPLPNWRIDYGGLSSLALIKRYFSSVNLNHSYTSIYNVGNYTSSLRYDADKINSQSSVFDIPVGTDTNGRAIYIPTYVIGQVSIQESFSPLLGVNLKTKKNVTFNIRYNLTRNLNLSTSNSQVMEMRSQDWSFSAGYTKTGLKLPVKYQQRTIVLKNEVTFRFDFTVRDNRTVQRRANDINVLTQGSQQIQIKPTINYRVNDRLSLQIYYDRTINVPRVSTSFRRTNTLFGVQVRFSLS